MPGCPTPVVLNLITWLRRLLPYHHCKHTFFTLQLPCNMWDDALAVCEHAFPQQSFS